LPPGTNGALKTSSIERLPGYAKVLLDYYGLQKDEAIIVISNSGINAVPVEIAMGAKERGLKVIAITSCGFSSSIPSRHISGKRLFELADVVIDNYVPPGDALVEVKGMVQKVGPISTIIDSAILHSISLCVVEKLLEKGVEPPVYMSATYPGRRVQQRTL